jgi:hypothetical protein
LNIKADQIINQQLLSIWNTILINKFTGAGKGIVFEDIKLQKNYPTEKA